MTKRERGGHPIVKNSLQQSTGLTSLKTTRSPGSKALRRFLRHRLALVGMVLMAVMAGACLAAPYITPYNPNQVNLRDAGQPPSKEHWFGTDRIGRDIFSRTLYGGRVSLAVGVLATAISTAIGTALGAVSGFYRGRVDALIMRFTDVVMTFPPIIIIMVVVSIVGPGMWKMIGILGVLSWPGVCRLVRAEFLALREMEFVEASIALGAAPKRIVFRHLLRNGIAPILVNASFATAAAILTESGLSFLGLGVPPPTASWGNMPQRRPGDKCSRVTTVDLAASGDHDRLVGAVD